MPTISPAEQRLAMAQIKVANIPGKKLEHQGIRVQLLGQIEMKSERGAPNDFLSLGTVLHHAVMMRRTLVLYVSSAKHRCCCNDHIL